MGQHLRWAGRFKSREAWPSPFSLQSYCTSFGICPRTLFEVARAVFPNSSAKATKSILFQGAARAGHAPAAEGYSKMPEWIWSNEYMSERDGPLPLLEYCTLTKSCTLTPCFL